MALGGTLLPSISTFASGPTVKSKSIGSANLVSSPRSLVIACQISHGHQAGSVEEGEGGVGVGFDMCVACVVHSQCELFSSVMCTDAA